MNHIVASASYAKQSVDHNYQSATGQSGIAAGSGGFDITVKGNTDLKGGALTSTAPIDKNSFTTGSLTTSDLTNRQNTDSRSESLSVSYGSNWSSAAANAATSVTNTALGNLNSGKGLPADKNESSQTLSVISPANVKITGTGNAEVDAKSAENVATLTSRDATTANGALAAEISALWCCQRNRDSSMNRSEKTALINAMPPREAWHAHLVRDMGAGGLFDVVKNTEQRGLFTNWRRVTTPVSLDFFDYAISTLCGAPEQTELIVTFLGYIRQEVERALTEPLRWEDEDRGAWGFPFMKATRWYDLQRSDLYSRALLGEPFTVEDRHFEALQGSAADWAAETGRNWDESSQSKYIECALVALAWGRLDMAQSLLKVRRSFKWTQRYVDWSRELVAQLAVQAPGQPVSQDSALWANFHSLFDELRHPTRTNKTGEASRDAARRGEARSSSEPSLLRLALAMIKQRWLLNKPIEPGLRDVIALISE